MEKEKQQIKISEIHPLDPFLPLNAKILLLGSFPPPKVRWSMDFYYPNLQNDMWRIIGSIFFQDKDYFIEEKRFIKSKIIDFCNSKGIALGDTGHEVYRAKGNASDQHLEIIRPIDLPTVLEKIPHCQALAVTGGKAAETLARIIPELHTLLKNKITSSKISFQGNEYSFYRMPSSSRAYPKAFADKVSAYEAMFREVGLL